jgi:FkbM family methyltransferase
MLPGLAKSAKKSINGVLNRLGYAVFKQGNLNSYPLTKHLADLFALYRIDCVFDVGGNEGQYGTLLRERVGYQGTIVSVEPVAEHAGKLRALAAGDPGWTVRQVALGAKPGRLSMNVTRAGVFSSFLAPDNSVVGTYADQREVVRTEQVEVTTFDALMDWSRAAGIATRNVFLKLDTQGYDLEVLAGAEHSLPAIQALQTEMSVQPIYQEMPDFRLSLDRITQLGFALSGIYPVSLDHDMKLIEVDCILVRPSRRTSGDA